MRIIKFKHKHTERTHRGGNNQRERERAVGHILKKGKEKMMER